LLWILWHLASLFFLNFYDQKQKQQQRKQMRERTFEMGVTLAQISTELKNYKNK